MKQAWIRWGQQGVRTVLPGVGLWVLLAVVAGVYARMAGLPPLPLIVTWAEWAAAILFLPPAAVFLLNMVNSGEWVQTGEGRLVMLARPLGWAGLVLFLLDLLTRAIFGLGWKPF